MRNKYEHDDWSYGVPGEYVYGEDIYVDDYYIDMDERWQPISGHPGYWVSNCERVWSEKTHSFRKLKEMDDHGHLGLALSDNGKKSYQYISRLMAQHFIDNPNNDPCVRHLDDNPRNNDIENLAWGTQADNTEDCRRNGHAYYLTDADREKGFQKARIPVMATNLTTGEEIRFRSQTDAARELGLQQSNVWKVLNGKRDKTCDYSFRYLPREDCDE